MGFLGGTRIVKVKLKTDLAECTMTIDKQLLLLHCLDLGGPGLQNLQRKLCDDI